MLETVIVFGLIIFVAIAVILAKLPLYWSLWLLNHHIALDIVVSVATLVIHWGTVTGLLAATVAGMVCSLCTTSARWLVGYRAGRFYYPGIFDLTDRILAQRAIR